MYKYFSFFLLFFAFNIFFASVRIESLNQDFLLKYYSKLNTKSQTRKIVPLLNNWQAFASEEREDAVNVQIPLTFDGTDFLFFETNYNFSEEQINNYDIYFVTENITNSTEFKINQQSVYKNPFSTIPFRFQIPSDILYANEDNLITLVVNSEINSKSTFPLEQQFLTPNRTNGIFGGIYLEFVPKTQTHTTNFNWNFNSKRKKLDLSFEVNISSPKENQTLIVQILSNSNEIVSTKKEILKEEVSFSGNFNFNFKDIKNPYSLNYKINLEILQGGILIDDLTEEVDFDKFTLQDGNLNKNNTPIRIYGVNYTPFSDESNPTFSYEIIQSDLELAKKIGFNTIRFNNSIPTPQILEITKELGLFVFIDIPMNMIPNSYFEDDIFTQRYENFTSHLLDYISNYKNVLTINIASSLNPHNISTINFVELISSKIQDSGIFSSASFLDFPDTQLHLDFVNIEFYSKIKEFKSEVKNNYLVTATYPAYEESKKGYLFDNSFEAQAKYFEKIYQYFNKNDLNGFFINSLTDYSGDYNSLYCSYSNDNLYKIGILGIDRKLNRTAYSVLERKFNNQKKINIPLGTTKNNTSLIFVIIPLGLTILLAITVNIRRKFREDSKRALFRSYNFFADIRDQRLLSGFHSYFMFFIVSATMSLLVVNLLFFLRENIQFEHLLLSFADESFIDFISYLSWNPLNAFYILFIIISLKLFFLVLLARFFAFFNRTKVLLTNIFYTATWAFMPITILLVLELLLLKILQMNIINDYIYIFIVIYFVWLLLRFIKGLYIIFDVFPQTAYLYTLISVLLFWGISFLYYHFSSNTWDFLITQISHIKYF